MSIAATIAIVAILSVYNHQKFPQVPGDISLNAVVATLSTVSKSSLIFSVSASLRQLKWDWYEKGPHKLEDFETFDAASRGPLSATKLLLGRHILFSTASIGAVITILALGIEPFVQQVAGTAERVSFVLSDDVWTPRLTRPSFFPVPGLLGNDSEYLHLLNGAVWNSASTYDLRAHCPSGDCQFEPFDTIEFCVEDGIVEDFSTMEWNCSAVWDREIYEGIFETWDNERRIKTTSGTCRIWLGRNQNETLYLEHPILYSVQRDGSMDISDTPGKPRAIMNFPLSILGWMQNDEHDKLSDSSLIRHRPVISYGFVRIADPDPLGTFDFRDNQLEWAEWAALCLCKATRIVSVTNGTTTVSYANGGPQMGRQYLASMPSSNPDENNPDERELWKCWAPQDGGTPDLTNLTIHADRIGGRDSQFVADPTRMAFCSTFFGWDYDIGIRLLSSVLKENLLSATNWTGTDPKASKPDAKIAMVYPIYEPSDAAKDILARVEDITLGSVVRTMVAALNNISFARGEEEPVRGSVKVTDIVVEVRWAWLTLLIGLEALGLILLVAVKLRKKQVAGLWKDSVLAVVYNGLDREDDSLCLQGSRTTVDIQQKAKATHVRLRKDGGRVMLAAA